MLRLYIIGPATGIPEDNRPAFEEARRKLADRGYRVSIPHDFIRKGMSHKTAMLISINELTARNYCAWDYMPGALGMRVCAYNGVAALPGWEQSPGACLEKQVAEACGIEVRTVQEWL